MSKYSNYRIPEGKERNNGIENPFNEIVAENFPNLEKDVDIEVQDTYMTPKRHAQKSSSLRQISQTLTSTVQGQNSKICKRRASNHT